MPISERTKIIESNHMDYSSSRVQFILGLFFLLACSFLLKKEINFINSTTAAIVGLLFYEIANRYSNRLQAVAATWTGVLWLFLHFTIIQDKNIHENSLSAYNTLAAILPVFVYLRYLLLNEKKYLLLFFGALFLSLTCGLSCLINSLSSSLLASYFLPQKYNSNPAIFNSDNSPDRKKISILLLATYAICYTCPLFLKNYSYYQNLELTDFGPIPICFTALLLFRLIIGKVFIAPILFCVAWAATCTFVVPHDFNSTIWKNEDLIIVPLSFLIIIASLGVFDIQSKRNAILLSVVGSTCMSFFCVNKGFEILNSKSLDSQIVNRSAEPNSTINQSGNSQVLLMAKDLNPQSISKAGAFELSSKEWISQLDNPNSFWFERADNYLNLGARPAKGQTKVIVLLAAVNVNPLKTNNVKIKLAFPLEADTQVNWLWQGNKSESFYVTPLKSTGQTTLGSDLKNNQHWQHAGIIEKIGLEISADNSSLAIENIEL